MVLRIKKSPKSISYAALAVTCGFLSFCTAIALTASYASNPQPPKQTQPLPSPEDGQVNGVRPGTSVGPIHLGNSKKEVLLHFKMKPNVDEDLEVQSCEAALAEIHWLDLGLNQNGIWFYLHGDIVFQIRSATSRFRTKEGITSGSAANLVQSNFGHLSAFRLTNSGNQATGWKDHVYWVDRVSGIAFEFNYDGEPKQWKVLSIYIFKPGEDFLPGGCIEPPQEWKQIPPYTF